MPLISIVLAVAAGTLCFAGELAVGPGQKYTRIEKALSAAKPGETIVVHPLPNNKPYTKVALYLTKAGITIKAADPKKRTLLSGIGFDYSGRGSVPRAIVQFNRGADGCRLEGFELSGAHNKSNNGAGVRINQANRELDLVDHKADTTRPESDAFLIGNIIVKAKVCPGNCGVIHFGQDGGNEHNGTLYLINNTIITPFISPVVYLSATHSSTHIYNNIICDGGAGQRNQILTRILKRVVNPQPTFISNNWLSHGFPDSTAIKETIPPFSAPQRGDYHLTGAATAFIKKGCIIPPSILQIIGTRLLEYKSPLNTEKRAVTNKPDLGAYEL